MNTYYVLSRAFDTKEPKQQFALTRVTTEKTQGEIWEDFNEKFYEQIWVMTQAEYEALKEVLK